MISQLEEQLIHAKQKLTEYNNHIQLLKHDIKVAQKVHNMILLIYNVCLF